MSSLDGLGPLLGPTGFGGGNPLSRGEALTRGPRPIGESPEDIQVDGVEGKFGNVLKDMIVEANERRAEVSDKVEALASGQPVDLHEVMVSMGKSEVTFNMMLEVRNKLIDAWREINRSVV